MSHLPLEGDLHYPLLKDPCEAGVQHAAANIMKDQRYRFISRPYTVGLPGGQVNLVFPLETESALVAGVLWQAGQQLFGAQRVDRKIDDKEHNITLQFKQPGSLLLAHTLNSKIAEQKEKIDLTGYPIPERGMPGKA